jgi:hypothetical protein
MRKSRTRWGVVRGIPNITQHWQVGDAEERNGAFKGSLAKNSSDLYLKKLLSNLPPNQKAINEKDVIILVSLAWRESFGDPARVQKALDARGLGAAFDRRLLRVLSILATKTKVSDFTSLPPSSSSSSSSSSSAAVAAVAPAPPPINMERAAQFLDALTRLDELKRLSDEAGASKRAEGVSAGTIDVLRPLAGVGRISSGKVWGIEGEE